MFKVLQLTIPTHEQIPEIITTFSPEENYLMLKIGSECLKEGRNAVAGLTQKEIYEKIKDETKEDIQRLELDLIVQKEMGKQTEDKMTKIYEGQVEKLEKQVDNLLKQIKVYEIESKDYEIKNRETIKHEVEKAREKYDILLKEKDKQNQLNREVFDKAIQFTNKSTSHKGSEGEKTFSEYAETFQDFKGFDIVDKHTQGGQGDFHLHFEEFDVLVDAKNYKKKVPIDQREKIKKDLLKNEHLHFAWLVSLNTSIEKYDKSPIMYEWINTKQCIVHINNLTSFEDPKKILRIVWFTCKELYKFTEDVNFDETELTELREKHFKMMDKVKNIRKTIREINTSMNATRNLIQVMDDELKGILEAETSDIVASNFSLFNDWWEVNLEITNDESLVASTDLWTRFKQENKLMISELNISGDKFKQYIKTKVPLSCIILRSKNANSAFDVKGLKMREVEQKVIENENDIENKIEVDFVEEIVTNKKKKIVKKEKIEVYFNEKLDKKIIASYEVKDIMLLSNEYNVRPWEIVSLLMRYKIIKKRNEAIGYDKYKETDEYKEKIKN
jgi:hypothetical protein